jgi:hypothetical protein
VIAVTLDAGVTSPPVVNAADIADPAHDRTIDLAGVAVVVGKDYRVTIDGTDFTHRAVTGNTLGGVASALAGLIDAHATYGAAASGDTITISDGAGTAVIGVILDTGVAGTPTVNAADVADLAHDRTIDLTGVEVVVGKDYKVTIDGTHFTHRAVTGNTLGDIASALAGLIDVHASYVAAASGSMITVGDGAGTKVISVTLDAGVDTTPTVNAADIADPSVSGKWGTSRARVTATAHSKASRAAALDARLAERAAANTGPDAPPLQASEDAGDEELKERKGSSKAKASRKAKKAAAEGVEKEGAAEAAGEEEEEEEMLNVGSASTFTELKLSKPLLKAISELGFAAPTPIQAAVLPPALRGLDVCASAVTGSGKTAAFLLPALERLLHRQRRVAAIRVLVLCPVRELAVQCEEMGRQLARFTDVRFAIVLGGLSLKVQEAELRSRPDIVVATPGRLIDLLRNTHSFDLEDLEVRSWPRRALLIALDCV